MHGPRHSEAVSIGERSELRNCWSRFEATMELGRWTDAADGGIAVDAVLSL